MAYRETLCWTCEKSGYGNVSECSWERKFEPVDGWDADATIVRHNNSGGVRETDSYNVKRCPGYVKENRNGKKEIADDG